MGVILLVGKRIEDMKLSVTDCFVQFYHARFAEDSRLKQHTAVENVVGNE